MPPSTVHRILSTLRDHGFVEQSEADQTWGIGVEAFRIGLGFQWRTRLIRVGRSAMMELMETTGETVNLGLLDSGEVVFISQIECREPIRAFFRTGERRAMHASGIGKALLSRMPPEKVLQILRDRGMTRFTGKTITDPTHMFSELALIRTRGWSVDDEEANSGMRCVAAAIYNEFGEAIAGISVSGPSARLPLDRLPELGNQLHITASRITDLIGGRRCAHAPRGIFSPCVYRASE